MDLARNKVKFLTAKWNFLFSSFKNRRVGIKSLGYLDSIGYF